MIIFIVISTTIALVVVIVMVIRDDVDVSADISNVKIEAHT